MIAAIEDGLYQPAMKARMTELERQKAEIAACLAQAPQPAPAIHPNMADAARSVGNLTPPFTASFQLSLISQTTTTISHPFWI